MLRVGKMTLILGAAALAIAILGTAVASFQSAQADDKQDKTTDKGVMAKTLGL